MNDAKEKQLKLSPAMEDYLEAISVLQEATGVTRVKEISEYLKVAPSSVNSAVNKLAKKNLVNHVKHGYIVLTDAAKERADKIRKKHKILKKFLIDILGLDPKISEEDACGMEHSISKQTLERLIQFVNFIEENPHVDENGNSFLLKNFQHFIETNNHIN